ncbi:MAG: hypothetical protein ABUS79_10920 [Pseudomonadota bacterium]
MSSRGAAARSFSLVGAAAAVMVAAGLGCYSPKVTPGGLACARAPAKQCPDDFGCENGVCVRFGGGATGGRGGAGGRGTGGGVGGRGAGGTGGGPTCANPIAPLCAASGDAPAACDPVCQTGCPCGLRCSVPSAGVGCATALGSKAVGQICQPGTDECAPGLICLQETCGTNLGRCYRFCRDASCGVQGVCGTPVKLPTGGSTDQRACNLGEYACDAFARTGCPDPALNCYVTGPSHMTCDCPSGRDRQQGESCIDYNDCAAGLVCLQMGATLQCHKLCKSAADCAGCSLALGTAGGFCP